MKNIEKRQQRVARSDEKQARHVTASPKDETGKVVSLEAQRAHVRASSRESDGLSQSFESFAESLPDLVCLSHLRWDFVYQRPQHLLSRCAKERRVFFIEEPVKHDGPIRLDVSKREDELYVVVPYLPHQIADIAQDAVQQGLIDRLFADYSIRDYVAWYYTPMALSFTRHLDPLAVIYDCMDELSAFKGAPPALRFREMELFNRADLVFTGGHSLYEVKRKQHKSVYAFPSSIDVPHFAQARSIAQDPQDQQDIPSPRLGFFGVIDERLDIELVRGIAEARPDWHLVMIGPVVKINADDLPRLDNIHYLGGKAYKELPSYLAGWDVALLPFARNDSTRFISPTKTPEYLAAGKPVVSTAIRDVVRPYGEQKFVRIADRLEDFVAAIEAAMNDDIDAHIRRVDKFLGQASWDSTWAEMRELIDGVVEQRLTSTASAQAAAAGSSGGRALARAATAGSALAAS